MFQLYYHSLRDGSDHKDSQLIGLALLEKVKENWKTMPQDDKVGWIEAAQKEEERYRVRLRFHLVDPCHDCAQYDNSVHFL